ncbi:MAG: serine hydrolase [Proteobacteria bacterium]|nr:MAG: serine hydrolase [Pseudomonadota bacterium]
MKASCFAKLLMLEMKKANPSFVRSAVILPVLLALVHWTRAAPPPPDLDALAERVRKEFHIPGLAIAIVKDGQRVVEKGYGVRRMNESEAVDVRTLFNIASNTKAFTAAALSLLVEEGRLHWDDPVTKHLPGFQMHDAWVTREMTVRDLLTHRSGLGLGAGDLLFWPPTTFTREEIVFRQRFIKAATSFRSHYAYDNCLYIVAGQIVQAASGKTWDEFVRERLLQPLRMTNSSINRDPLASVMNKAASHVEVGERLEIVDYANAENLGPAGGINSCAADMASWVLALLGAGEKRDGGSTAKRILNRRRVQEMWSSQTPIPVEDPGPKRAAAKPNFAAYGLGFALRDYRGHKLVWHSGGLPGQISRVTLAPDLRLGIVLLSNKEPNQGLEALTYHILDFYLQAADTDWIGAYRKAADEKQTKAAETMTVLNEKRAKDTKPSLPLDKYAGSYLDAWYGEVTIRLEDGKLVLHFTRTPALAGELEHWQHDSFVAHWRDRSLQADAFVYFALKPDGTIDSMKMAAVSPLTDFSFDFQDLNFMPAAKSASR